MTLSLAEAGVRYCSAAWPAPGLLLCRVSGQQGCVVTGCAVQHFGVALRGRQEAWGRRCKVEAGAVGVAPDRCFGGLCQQLMQWARAIVVLYVGAWRVRVGAGSNQDTRRS